MKLIDAITRLGGLSGLATSAFLIYDRLIRGRPLPYLSVEQQRVHLRVRNETHEAIIIDKIQIRPPVLEIISASNLRAELQAAASLIAAEIDENRFLFVDADGERAWPLTFKLGALPDKAVIKICLTWRNTRRPLPFPRKIRVRTTAYDLRSLQEEARRRPA